MLAFQAVGNLELAAVPDALLIGFGGVFIATELVFNGRQGGHRPGGVIIVAGLTAFGFVEQGAHGGAAAAQGQGVVGDKTFLAPGTRERDHGALLFFKTWHGDTILEWHCYAVDRAQFERWFERGDLALKVSRGEEKKEKGGGRFFHGWTLWYE